MKIIIKVAAAIAFSAMCGNIHATGDGKSAEDELAEINKMIAAMIAAAPKGPHGGKLISPELKELMDRRSGGLVYPKTNGNALLIVDARGGDDDSFVEEFAKELKRSFYLNVATRRRTVTQESDLFAAASAFKTDNNPAVIMIVDVENKPTLASYPEDAVGVVNANRLKDDDLTKYKGRLAKEVWRGMALSLGGFATTAPNGRIVKSILSPVYSAKDLDTMAAKSLSPHQCNAIYESVATIGLQASKPVSYKMACKQGWAPAPTNSIQRAIWNEVFSVPDKPITIEFDPKKDK